MESDHDNSQGRAPQGSLSRLSDEERKAKAKVKDRSSKDRMVS